jgi:hypothetical protein
MSGIIEDIQSKRGIVKYCVVHALAEDKARAVAIAIIEQEAD